MKHSKTIKAGQPFDSMNGAVQVTPVTRNVIRITFHDQGVGGVSEHLEELDAIRTAGANDTLVLYFSGCPGGDVSTGMAIMNGLMTTQAKSIAVIEGHNASLATMIPMVCDEVVVTPHCSMMVHTANGVNWGTVPNMERHAAFNATRLRAFMDEVYDGFLSKEEIDKLQDGVEIYLSDADIMERLEKRAEAAAAAAAAEDAGEDEGEQDQDPEPEPVVVKRPRIKR